MELPTYRLGIPSWIEYKGLDPDRAGSFYSVLFGWRNDQPEDLEDRRTVLLHDESEWRVAYQHGKPVAAFTPKYLPTPPGWLTYVSVTDADATARAVKLAGGQVISEPADVADVGRAAVFTDPAGAAFGIWQPVQHEGAALVSEPGTLRRNELETQQPERAIPFYRTIFGWEPVPVQVGQQRLYDWQLDGQAVAGLKPIDPGTNPTARSQWLAYFDVADVNATAERTRQLGGTVHVPPSDVPSGRFAILGDSLGARFGVLRLTHTQPGRP
jgi:uncharacterized protein